MPRDRVLGLVVGLLTVRLLVICGRDCSTCSPSNAGTSADRPLPTAAGLLVVLAVFVVEAGRGTLGAFGRDEPGRNIARPLVFFACLGFGLLGLIDDLLGTEGDRGFVATCARSRRAASRPARSRSSAGPQSRSCSPRRAVRVGPAACSPTRC